MEETSNELPFLSNIGLMLSFRCPITCPHCIVNAGPGRKELIPVKDCLKWINESRLYGKTHIQGIAITGGEPFYHQEDLKLISDYGKERKFIISVVTNAFWANTREEAFKILSRFPNIHMISISTDVYHQKYIPFENVQYTIHAAKELGKLYNIAICAEDFLDPEYVRIKESLIGIGEEDRIRESIVTPIGRAKHRARHVNYSESREPTKAACNSASSPVIFPGGKVSACIGPALTLDDGNPLILGNMYKQPLKEIMDGAELNPILHTIRVWGPHKLIELLSEHGFEERIPDNFIKDCVCDVCYKLMSDDITVRTLKEIFDSDYSLREKTAYGRLYYLDESKMIEQFIQ